MLQHTELAKKFYRSKSWRNTRNAYMVSVFSLCERCGQPADIVHHKIYIDIDNINNPDVTLDWNNLEAVCIKCHNQEHFKGKVLEDGFYFDADGQLRFNN